LKGSKQEEEGIRNENIALREEIVNASMFEEIVGTSPPLHAVLTLVAKVAPTDSTVLITGETGTGKELIARAIHKRSARSARAFVSVNCACYPTSVDPFGAVRAREGGVHRRNSKTSRTLRAGRRRHDLFGRDRELPVETQIALLRVLQEHEFERVGRKSVY